MTSYSGNKQSDWFKRHQLRTSTQALIQQSLCWLLLFLSAVLFMVSLCFTL